MAAGGPGDHPLKDILHFNMNVYDRECDTIIRELSKYISEDELYESIDWFSTFSMNESQLDDFKVKLSRKLIALKNIAGE
jgi:hypothetical protein